MQESTQYIGSILVRAVGQPKIQEKQDWRKPDGELNSDKPALAKGFEE